MSGLTDKISGKVKQAAGDLAGDAKLRHEGVQEERKAQAKEELAQAQRQADMRSEEIARLERETSRSHTHGASGDSGEEHSGGQSGETGAGNRRDG